MSTNLHGLDRILYRTLTHPAFFSHGAQPELWRRAGAGAARYGSEEAKVRAWLKKQAQAQAQA